MNNHVIYFDHSATTPVSDEVVQAMLPYWTTTYGNPSSSHAHGRAAKQGLESARRSIASTLGAKPSEIVFTGCGSESDNLAIRGVMMAARAQGQGNHLITSVIEHEAILQTAEQLRDIYEFDITVVGVDKTGRVDPAEVKAALRSDTALISIMAANNEVGTIQPIMEIGQIAQEAGALFHTDAVQAATMFDWQLDDMPIDLLSLAPHKFYGPKGVGILYVRENIDLVSSMTGGGQEDGRRAGTVNVPFAVGSARALELAVQERDSYIDHCITLRDRLINGLLAAFPRHEMVLTGHADQRLPHHASFAFRDLTGNDLLIQLDVIRIAGSSGSACSSGNPEPSAILKAMGYDDQWARGGLRLTVGKHNTLEEVDYAVKQIPEVIAKLRTFMMEFS